MTLVELDSNGSRSTYSLAYDVNIENIDDYEINQATFVVSEYLAVNPGDEIKFYDDDDVLQFAGKCLHIEPQEIGKKLECYSYEVELTQQTVTDVFENISLESFVETIVESYSTLTFSTTLSTGITIDYYLADKKYAWDIFKDILTANSDLTYYVNYSTKVLYLFRKGDTTSSLSLVQRQNCIFKLGWKQITDKQVTRLNLIGGKEIRNGFSETFSGTGAQTQFITTNIFNNIKVSVGGVEKSLQVTGQNTGDFTVVPKEKKIDFLSAPVSGTDNIIATYDYEIPIDLTGIEADYSLIQQYGIIEKSIVRNHLKSTDDAIAYGYAYVNRWARPVYSNTAEIISTLDLSSIRPGDKIYVVDTDHYIEGNTIAAYFLIKAVYYSYATGLRIELGDTRSEVLSFIKELQYQVQQLEQNNINVSITTKVQTVSNNALITLGSEIVSITRRTWGTDTFYLDENGSAVWNQMKDDGLGPIMRDTGGYTDEPILTTYLATESLDLLTTESGDNIILE